MDAKEILAELKQEAADIVRSAKSSNSFDYKRENANELWDFVVRVLKIKGD